MADSVLFIGWGVPVRGRERPALTVFNDAHEYYGRLQQQGEIESFETVLLEPHGGDLGGFTVLRGDQHKIAGVRGSDEFARLIQRAQLLVEHLGVVGGAIGDRLMSEIGSFAQNIEELT